jgi:hypothetical protein
MFSLVDTRLDGETRIIEHGNPPFLFIRNGQLIRWEPQTVTRECWKGRSLSYWLISTQVNDRIVLFSDGVTQSGMGTREFPLGWSEQAASDFTLEQIRNEPDISARSLSRRIVERAVLNDGTDAGDDVTCGVIYFRSPRRLLVLTGPPFSNDRDGEYVRRLENFKGRSVICGGTTANIVARELRRDVTTDLENIDPEVPSTSRMDGVDLITEGTLTLGKVAELLESGAPGNRRNGATMMMEMLLESDYIEFIVGTKVNQAHQDPRLPIELDIRRNVIKKIVYLLQEKYLKETKTEFF